MNLILTLSADVNIFYDTIGKILLVTSDPLLEPTTRYFTIETGSYNIDQITQYRIYLTKDGLKYTLLLDEYVALVNSLSDLQGYFHLTNPSLL